MTDIQTQMREAASTDFNTALWRKLLREGADEIERLRAALHYYADFHENPNDGPWGVQSDDFGHRARAALTSTPARRREQFTACDDCGSLIAHDAAAWMDDGSSYCRTCRPRPPAPSEKEGE